MLDTKKEYKCRVTSLYSGKNYNNIIKIKWIIRLKWIHNCVTKFLTYNHFETVTKMGSNGKIRWKYKNEHWRSLRSLWITNNLLIRNTPLDDVSHKQINAHRWRNNTDSGKMRYWETNYGAGDKPLVPKILRKIKLNIWIKVFVKECQRKLLIRFGYVLITHLMYKFSLFI